MNFLRLLAYSCSFLPVALVPSVPHITERETKSLITTTLETNPYTTSQYADMKTQDKWYNDPQMVGTLLLFWPPVGIYGLYKSETIEPKWRRVAYVTLGLVAVLLVMIILS